MKTKERCVWQGTVGGLCKTELQWLRNEYPSCCVADNNDRDRVEEEEEEEEEDVR